MQEQKQENQTPSPIGLTWNPNGVTLLHNQEYAFVYNFFKQYEAGVKLVNGILSRMAAEGKALPYFESDLDLTGTPQTNPNYGSLRQDFWTKKEEKSGLVDLSGEDLKKESKLEVVK